MDKRMKILLFSAIIFVVFILGAKVLLNRYSREALRPPVSSEKKTKINPEDKTRLTIDKQEPETDAPHTPGEPLLH